ncbi:hypothetical protein J5226_18465 [Lysobacter sp. K5869]|uniref:hypothetical protein n=1 Tax=Lysobacter sp. K5869 TaxID=2820808 RepID=UPI001C05FA8A|nr:hypothetical protein [Lysobacter sp. K5869]QWP75581.1 hypothetical protein J5226_18465 [Lysobacter sp. K5869]
MIAAVVEAAAIGAPVASSRLMLAALAGLLVGLSMAGGWWWGMRRASRAWLARRADRNGRALLQAADEMDVARWQQRVNGVAVAMPGHWARLCRRAALDQLECINRLMIEEAPRD